LTISKATTTTTTTGEIKRMWFENKDNEQTPICCSGLAALLALALFFSAGGRSHLVASQQTSFYRAISEFMAARMLT
jgi:hypothetical protein